MLHPLKNLFKKPTETRSIHNLADVGNSKAFCMKPWVHFYVSQQATVVPCCITPWEKEQALGDINEQSVQEIWNGEPMRQLRLKMLRDEPDKRCWQCYENEKTGLLSDRIHTNFHYIDKLDWALGTLPDGTAPDSQPIYWDIRFSNQCNFKCRICGHHSSSQWYDDAKAMGILSGETRLHKNIKDLDRLLQQLDFVIPHLEQIYFAGGEPLIMAEHMTILKMLIERGRTDVRLQYSTNFSETIYKGTDIFELWAQFEHVTVLASLDGTAARGELQRSGQAWQQVLDNRQRMMQVCPNAIFCITPTISVFNILHLPDFHRQWTENGLIQVDEFMPHTLKFPEEYNIRVLPPSLKAKATQKIEEHIEWIIQRSRTHPLIVKPLPLDKFERVKAAMHWIIPPPVTGHIRLDIVITDFKNALTYMNAADDTHLLPKFRESTLQLDQLRGENTRAVFPELEEMWVE